jgi:hypothetical protein
VVLVIAAALLALPAFASAAQTLKVNGITGSDTGNCVDAPCATIGYAIGQAGAGDKVEVAAGHYEEKLTIDKQLTLEGAPAGGTEIGPLAPHVAVAGSTITLGPEADGATLRNLEVNGRSSAEQDPVIGTSAGPIDDVTIDGVEEVGLGPSTFPTDPPIPSTVAAGLEISVPTEGWTITDSSFDLNYFGIVVKSDSTDMTVVDTTFTHDRSGFYTQRNETSPGSGAFVGEVDGLRMIDCEFFEDQYRGMYFEGLSHAEIIGATVIKAGATAPQHPFGARGISFNLKAGTYEDIEVIAADVREAENEGISIQVRGSATDTTYHPHPATLNQIEIAESTVTANDGPGIVIENSTQLGTTTISGSRVFGNARKGIPSGDTASGIDAWDEGAGAPTVDAANNWFGCNAGPTAAGAGCDTVNPPVHAGPWLVLTAAAEKSVLTPGATTNVRAALDSNSAGQTGLGFPAGPPVAVNFAATNGLVVPAAGDISGGEAFATYVAGADGDAGLSATVDNQTVGMPLTVQTPAPPAPPVQKPVEAPPAAPPTPAPSAPPVTIERTETKNPPTVAANGNVTVATVECASSSCQVEARKPTITIGGQNYKIKVKVPDTVAGGSSAPVKVILPKKVREALEEKGKGKVKVKLTVTTADGQTKTVTVTVNVKAKKKTSKS